MNVLMPIFAVAVALTFDLHPAVKLALVVLSVSPIPPILPNKALKAGGRADYTIGLLVAVSILSVIFIPITLEVFERVSKVAFTISASVILKVVLTTVLAPLLAGIICRALSERIADKAAKPIALVGMLALVLCCLPLLVTSTRAILTLIGDGTLIALSAFAIVGLIVGHLLGGPAPQNRPVLALATSARHPAVALSIAHANFPDQKLAGPLIVVYLVISVILSIPYLKWVRRESAVHAHSEKPVQA